MKISTQQIAVTGVQDGVCSSALQAMEDLEQLKVLESGYRIKVITVAHTAHGVDEPEDVGAIEAKMRELGLT